jgi:LmbE family N-acetylglucosaminyl deacetylase
MPKSPICREIRKKHLTVFLLLYSIAVFAQKAPEPNWNSSRILFELTKMESVGRILYIAAHPDDENTQLISYLENVKGIETAYMSLNRGDGGQNLIGSETGEELGVIRTQELMMARSVDGGEQFFSRANDFGFSKSAKETFHIWDSAAVLSDIVWVIRNFKPDIIITRFSPTYTKTHGHHQASAILAEEAFDDAANPAKFPEQLSGNVTTWQAKSIFWNTNPFFFPDKKFDTTGLCYTDIGDFMPLLGKSVGEVAAESRSMHKSQGFGAMARRGTMPEYFVLLKGEKPVGRDIFSVADWDWDRIKEVTGIGTEIDKIINEFDVVYSDEALDELIALREKLKMYSDNYLVASKLKQLDDIILQCAGVYAEALCPNKYLAPGDTLHTTLNVIAQNTERVRVESAVLKIGNYSTMTFEGKDGKSTRDFVPPTTIGTFKGVDSIGFNTNRSSSVASVIPVSTPITGPYWLEKKHSIGMYKVDEPLLRGMPENPLQIFVQVVYSIDKGKTEITKNLPVFNKIIDPVKGEVYSMTRIVPPAIAIPENKLLVFKNDDSKELKVTVKSFSKGKGILKIDCPPQWRVSPVSYNMDMKGEGTEQTFDFKVSPFEIEQTLNLGIQITTGGHTYNRSMEVISYPHIPEQVLLPESTVKAVRIDMEAPARKIGYIVGAGDQVPEMLRQVGYTVEIIAPEHLADADFSKYDVIIAGVRAYNTVKRLQYNNSRLMEYVQNGGTYIVQYNTLQALVTKNIGPYPLNISTDRVTEEDCKVTFLDKNNPVLSVPNKITNRDFDGWVQERGLYYPDKWDTTHYVPVLAMHDEGEKPLKGALLIAKYGKGYFIYTGLDFFRELPAGVPGAYRLMANLIEIGKHN